MTDLTPRPDPSAQQPIPTVPARLPALAFGFDGGAATWLGVGIGGFLITVLTLGICYPWAVVMTYRWKSKHTYINGRRLRFTGSAWGLFGMWIKWLLLCIITIGIYGFWVYPRLQKWIVEHQELDPAA
ncbi:DUF898 family protein [Microbacterium sp. G2-8]|uniref:DUF898 family protein n=1 Tax=Microbacterium sp. G2-8 TaxID=2842454 RepID=UPI001C899478|nr:DUF898 family protein [Microbacterium sp. G2-8]